jgi:hypothetical protein
VVQETIDQPTYASEAPDSLAAAALRAEAWAGEPFLHPEEDPADVLARGTARRRALDDAIAEIESGRKRPSPEWRVRFGLMLGRRAYARGPSCAGTRSTRSPACSPS